MKVLIFACLVALALAKQNEENVFSEKVEKLSSGEETTTQIIKENVEKVKFEEQQPKEDEHQNKMHPLFQQQSQFYSTAMPFPYTVFPQNFLSLAQHAVLPSFFQQETMENPKVKETVSPNCKVMRFPKYFLAPSFEHQIPNFTDVENLHFSLPLFQPLMQHFPQVLPQIPLFPPQSWQPMPQPRFLPAPQQEMPYTHRYMPFQALPLYQEPLFYPAHNRLYL